MKPTREQVLQWAREVGFHKYASDFPEMFEAFAALAYEAGAAELRRLHEVNAELMEALKTCEWVDDGGYGHAEYDAVKVAAALAKAQGENND